jgi:hypothetical protein
MKTVFTKKEGVKMNSSLDFGDTTNIINEFEYLMNTTETMFDVEVRYFYRITDDNYIQLASKFDSGNLNINAQYKLKFENFKENIIFIVKENIEAHLLYHGFPTFEDSIAFTRQEFDVIIQNMEAQKGSIIEQAKSMETPLIVYLREQDLYPQPTGNNPNSWIATCPNGGKHFIQVVTTNDQWGCGYCKRKGNQTELEKWLQELKSMKFQKKLSIFMKKLKRESIIKLHLLKWRIDDFSILNDN